MQNGPFETRCASKVEQKVLGASIAEEVDEEVDGIKTKSSHSLITTAVNQLARMKSSSKDPTEKQDESITVPLERIDTKHASLLLKDSSMS